MAILLAGLLAVAAQAAETETGESAGPRAVEIDLDAEWQFQFEDLSRQIAGWEKHREQVQRFRRAGYMEPLDHASDLVGETFRHEALILPEDRDPVDIVARRTAAVLSAIGQLGPAVDLTPLEGRLKELTARAAGIAPGQKEARQELFADLCRLRRAIVLANPLLDFSDIAFITRAGAHEHCCDQYFGFTNDGGGGLFVLEGAFGPEPVLRDVLAESPVERGRLKGQKLQGGAFLSPALSYDAKTLAFAYAEKTAERPNAYTDECWAPEHCFHLFKVSVDATGLEQLTDGPFNEFDPCFLPNGRVAFISERRGGFGRCHGRPVPTYTLHSMRPDGTGIVCLSYHETNEWNPSVTHNGMIIYARWDYVDRFAVIAHHPWLTTPDGCDARALHGNYPVHETFRPHMEAHVRAVPGSERFLATATAHHGQSVGSLVLLDFSIPDDDMVSQVKRLTPDMPFPESEGPGKSSSGWFATAWPLSEDFFLAVYQPRATPRNGVRPVAGIYLVDSFGNRELIYRHERLRCWSPIPLRPRVKPPVLPERWDVERAAESASPEGKLEGEAVVAVMNVYDGLLPWPEGTNITSLRVVQVFPKSTPINVVPRIGGRQQLLARGVLGTVPVEEDGSAHFILPAGKAVYFQALGSDGLAVQSMMSDTYAHPGERLICQGCHEPRREATPPATLPLALQREPSRLRPEVEGSWPMTFPRLVQPVLDAKCVACHAKEAKAPPLGTAIIKDTVERTDIPLGWSEAYASLAKYPGGSGAVRSVPGRVGARTSKLLRLLEKGHYDVELSDEQLHRITLWLDCGAPFFGAYERTQEQAQGEIVLPLVQ